MHAVASNFVIGSVWHWPNKPNPNKKPIRYFLVTAVTPDDLGRVISLGCAIQDIGQAVSRVNDDVGSGFDKTVANQLHASPAAIAHSGRMALSGAVMSYFDKCFPIFSEK